MGGGGYSQEAHEALTTARKDLPKEQVFKEVKLHAKMSPFGVKVRESRDSAAHPDSIGLMLVLDETGSMGHMPHMLATEEMPHLMGLVLPFLPDVQIFPTAIGDALSGWNDGGERETSSLQVGQFESAAEPIDEWLTKIHLEGQGGGNGGESYDLALYFAARHTAMDCWEKRGRKGYLFIVGDEPHFDDVDRAAVKRIMGDEIPENIPIADIVKEVTQTYHPFFLIPDLGRRRRCEASWRGVLGDNVICMEEPHDFCSVVAMIVGLNEGMLENIDTAAKRLEDLGKDKTQIGRVIRAIEPFASSIGRGGKVRPTKKKGTK